MWFDVADGRAGRRGQRRERADLVDDVGGQVGRLDVDESPAEAGEVAIADLGADAYPPIRGRPAHRQQVRRIAGVEAARDIGRGDDVEHGVVITECPDAEPLAEVGVEVHRTRCHRPSLVRCGPVDVDAVVSRRVECGVVGGRDDGCARISEAAQVGDHQLSRDGIESGGGFVEQ